ncbi:hypothetical protein SLA2020_339670 [Shorea laevis]
MLGLFEEGGDFRLIGFVDQIDWFFHCCRGRGLVKFQEALRSTSWADFTVNLPLEDGVLVNVSGRGLEGR